MRAYSLGPWLCLVLLAVSACKPPRRHPQRRKGHAHARAVSAASAAAISAPTAVTSALSGPPARSALERREACEFKKGDLPEKTLSPGDPLGQRIPIDHFVIVMQENRSFDHYFQQLPKFGQPDADVAPPDYQNHDSS